ncbi:MAG: hypothetical protein M0C28_00840 [Candidatus Moduliflexus flocculans]|nr:hypothetical protein [Candidatus Moduliflexus flocculans]
MFEKTAPGEPVYRVEAVDARRPASCSPTASRRGSEEIPLSNVLPEWGTAQVTTAGLRIVAGGTVVCDQALADRPREVLGILPGGGPAGPRRPHPEEDGRRADLLQAALLQAPARRPPGQRAGLPDRARRGDRLLARGRPRRDLFRYARPSAGHHPLRSRGQGRGGGHVPVRRAPGNVFPSLHPSLEGGAAAVRIVLEDWPAAVGPDAPVRWKEKGREEVVRKTSVPGASSPRTARVSELVFDGRSGRVAGVVFESDWEKEADYLAVVDLLGTWRAPRRGRARRRSVPLPRARRRRPPPPLPVPGEGRAVGRRPGPSPGLRRSRRPVPPPAAGRPVVTTREHHLARHGRGPRPPAVRARRRQGLRRRPVLRGPRRAGPRALPAVREVRLPAAPGHPQADAPGRRPPARQRGLFDQLPPPLRRAPGPRPCHPGGAQEDELRLRAHGEPGRGRAGLRHAEERALPQPARRPLRRARRGHGLPDRGQAPAARRPPSGRGSTTAGSRTSSSTSTATRPTNGSSRSRTTRPTCSATTGSPRAGSPTSRRSACRSTRSTARPGAALMKLIAAELNADPAFAASNRKFYDRYERWAARWAPHMNELEIADGVNIFAKRRGPAENRLTPRTQTTFNEQTPELMDETATGDWLEFLCGPGPGLPPGPRQVPRPGGLSRSSGSRRRSATGPA